MRSSKWVMGALFLGTVGAASAACSSTSTSGTGGGTTASGTTTSSSSTTTSSGTTGTGGSVSQTPPQGETAVKAWLATGAYKSWKCQPAEHVAVAPSPHSYNRICSNDVLAAGSPPFAVGAAAVKELYSDSAANGGKVFGYAVYLKTAADDATNSGANWYWYEDNPTLDPDGGVVADGLGTSGNPKTVCVGCHSLAGSDANHMGAGDFVYTQVKM